jgi:NAD(P)H dehydrogenase (quinone)
MCRMQHGRRWPTADAIVFGSPTYMGTVSWQFKKFADASSKPWFGQKWKDKLAAGFTNSASMNGDKHSTLHYLMTLAMQHSMLWVGTGLMPSNSKAAKRDDVNYVASFAGAMASTPSDAGVDEMHAGDLETARLFGAQGWRSRPGGWRQDEWGGRRVKRTLPRLRGPVGHAGRQVCLTQ